MKTFDDLIPEDNDIGGQRAMIFFDNGYGASVISGGIAYDDDDSPFELAVLKGTENNWAICYDTEITDDVVGHLTNEKVTELLIKIQNLEN